MKLLTTVTVYAIRVFERLWGVRASSRMCAMFAQLQLVTVGTSIAGLLTFGLTLLAARRIGPASYGTFTLFSAIAVALSVPMLFGLNTAVAHLLARTRNRSIITTAAALAGVSGIMIGVLTLLFGARIFHAFHLPQKLLLPALVFAFVLTFYFLGEGLLRGAKRMHSLAALRIAQAFTFTALLAAAFLFSHGAATLAIATAAGTFAFAALAFFSLRKDFRKPKRALVRPLLHYATFAFVGAITGALFEVTDKFLLNRYGGPTMVGWYSAYAFLSTVLVAKFLGLLMTVLFPTLSTQRAISAKLNPLINRTALFVGLGTAATLSVGVPLLGSSYAFSPLLVLLFAFAAALYFLAWAKLWSVSSTGIRGIRAVACIGFASVGLNIVLNVFLIPRFSVYGAVTALIIALSVLAACAPMLQRRYGGMP